ncbi:hypothetical protein CHS0354_027071, partial [Potamilus streckersoni]
MLGRKLALFDKKCIPHMPDSTSLVITGIFKREGREIATEQIGFCATNVNGLTSLHENEIVNFDNVLHNESNGFNKQTGIFLCPLSGTYFFTVSVMTMHGFTTAVRLIVSGEIKGRSFADG